jgi:hypothetical protein
MTTMANAMLGGVVDGRVFARPAIVVLPRPGLSGSSAGAATSGACTRALTLTGGRSLSHGERRCADK